MEEKEIKISICEEKIRRRCKNRKKSCGNVEKERKNKKDSRYRN